jgi:hypothetical protein
MHVAIWRFCANFVAVEMHKMLEFRNLFVCSLSFWAFTARAPYYIVIRDLHDSITYFHVVCINNRIFEKKN